MMDGSDAARSDIVVLSYNDLISIVAQLKSQVDLLSAHTAESSCDRANASFSSRNETNEFRIVPDLNKTVNAFKGKESPHQAEDWLEDVNGVAVMNGWPLSYRLQFVRANLQGSARDWFMGKRFEDWKDFERRFRATFIRKLNMSDRYDLLKAKLQSKDESVMDYFQPKVRLCRDLSLSFEETSDQVLKGLYSREMALYALSQKHTCEEDLLSNLLEWTRMSKIHGAENKLRIPKPHPNKFELKSKSNSNASTWPKAVAIAPIKESMKKPTESADESPCC